MEARGGGAATERRIRQLEGRSEAAMASFQSPEQRERRVATSAATPSGSGAVDEDVSVVKVVVVKGAGGGRIGRMDETAAPTRNRGCEGLFGGALA